MAAIGSVGSLLGSELLTRRRQASLGVIEGGLFELPYSRYLGLPMVNEAFKNKAAFRWEVGTFAIKSIPISTPAHSIEPVPNTTHLSVATPKNSNVLSLIDWNDGVEVATLKQPEGNFFYGHCGFDEKKSVVIASSWQKNRNGEFVICDLEDLKRLETISIPFGRPHQMVRISGRELLVGIFNHGGFDASLAIVDIESGRVDRLPIGYGDSHQRIVGHFVRLDSSRICWTANTHRRDGSVNFPSLVIFNQDTRAFEVHRIRIGDANNLVYDVRAQSSFSV